MVYLPGDAGKRNGTSCPCQFCSCYGSLVTDSRSGSSPPRGPAPTIHAFRTRDGVRLHVESRGVGPTMLLCNGLFCSTHYFVPWWDHFSRDYRLVQFDYRGHGRSDDAPDPTALSIALLTDDAEQVMNATCPDKTILVGHSMGVRIALELYARQPERISALLLLCGSAFDSLGPLFSRLPMRTSVLAFLLLGDYATPFARIVKDAVLHADLVARVAYLVGGMSRELTPREPIEGLMRNLERLDVRLMPPLARSYIRHSARRILPQVDVPTLFLVGEKDSLALPSHARKVVRLLPHGEAYVVRGCTHLAPVERPDEVHSVAESFLARHHLAP